MTYVIYTWGMGHSREDKEKSHRQIVEIAAARMREAGTDGPGVAEIMREAGLTHGGFYKHFDSRDDLVAEAVELAAAQGEEAYRKATDDAADPLAGFVDWYLSADHRDDPGAGCAVVALGADAARGDERVRAAYRGQVERYIAHLEELLGGGEDARRPAIAAVTSMVGAMLVARAIGDEELSEEILRETRASVENT
jgi:TetR/AcrR family transcriptional regulator, transcriptional repressor for nem operon